MPKDPLALPWMPMAGPSMAPHGNAPVADLPVRRFVEAHHFIAGLALP